MTRRLIPPALLATLILALACLLLLPWQGTRAAADRRVSAVLDVSAAAAITAVLPDVSAFTDELRGGAAMRTFFDSPLGLHFLRSAPLRGAAYLHRLISLAPKSWQWGLSSMITDGPVYYRSQAGSFTLVIALNRKGRAFSSLTVGDAAARFGDWLIVASDRQALQAQLAYLAKPEQRESKLDSAFQTPAALSLLIDLAAGTPVRRGLTRALLSESLGLGADSKCLLTLRPGGDSLGLEGECTAPVKPHGARLAETLTMNEFPAYAYFRRPEHSRGYLIALGGLTADSGYLVPRLFFTGPVADHKTLEFLTQAFKVRRHVVEAHEQGARTRYPAQHSANELRFDLFAPYLFADRERFFWHSFLGEDAPREQKITLDASHDFYLSLQLFPLLQRCEKALRQLDAVYSPGHFHEFLDALAKSMPALANTSVKLFSTPAPGSLRLGGAISFAVD